MPIFYTWVLVLVLQLIQYKSLIIDPDSHRTIGANQATVPTGANTNGIQSTSANQKRSIRDHDSGYVGSEKSSNRKKFATVICVMFSTNYNININYIKN